jgi:hypothetical protein
MGLDVRQVDLELLNSMTKYPSIPTYHEIGARGMLQPDHVSLRGRLHVTEKVDGTNSRVIVLPRSRPEDPGYLIGSREDLLTAQHDVIYNPAQGIVPAVREAADRLAERHAGDTALRVFFFETFGGKATASSKQYTGEQRWGVRLFDVLEIEAPDLEAMLGWPRERIAAWRDNGGQRFLATGRLQTAARELSLELVPPLLILDASELPESIEETHAWLQAILPTTRCALDAGAGGRPEGVVARTEDRGQIVKIRFEDYERSLRAARGR